MMNKKRDRGQKIRGQTENLTEFGPFQAYFPGFRLHYRGHLGIRKSGEKVRHQCPAAISMSGGISLRAVSF